MILYIQATLIAVLVFTLIALYFDETHKRRFGTPTGKMTQCWDGSERRRFVRIAKDISIKYSMPKEADKYKVIKTNNISIGGICMTINEKFSLKALLSIEIALLDSPNPIFAKGEVVWVTENPQQDNDGIRYFDIGIEFKDILPQDRERLFKFIKQESELNQSG